MSDHQYFRSFDADGGDSLSRIARLIPDGACVLDLGCGPGVLARHLVDAKACVVDGVELDAVSAEHARGWLRDTRRLDLDAADVTAAFAGRRYDRIICADILEHLREPARLLRQLPGLLSDDGRVIVSVPNVAHAGLIGELLGGDFTYRPEGLLDRTHLRFFTRRSLETLLAECGFAWDDVQAVDVPVERSEFAAERLRALPDPVRAALLDRPDAQAYQFIALARPARAPVVAGTGSAKDRPVDIVIPVYGNAEDVVRCLDSVMAAANSHACEIVVVDDASPDPALGAHLGALAEAGRITLLRHGKNLGFAAAVNTGIALHPDRDVVLLNSDTVVANDWLDRLRRAAHADADTGTVTPFSNAATICSYPVFGRDNPMPAEWTVAELDTLFRRVNRDRTVEIPVGVGFCLYIRRDCLDATGPFDADLFGVGYGEENDFCMRARAKGWRHRLAADCFVWHRGGGSFGAEKAERIARAQERLRLRHPTHDELVTDHLARDPARPLRRAVDLARLQASPRPKLLFVSHDLGGGVARHVLELAARIARSADVVVLFPASPDRLALRWERAGEDLILWFDRTGDREALAAMLRGLGIARAHVHHTAGHDQGLVALLRGLDVPFDVTLHDYAAVCPEPHLVRFDGRTCPLPVGGACEICGEVAGFREAQRWLLDEPERLFVPSASLARAIAAFAPKAPVLVVPHGELEPPIERREPAATSWTPGSRLRVAVVGTLSLAKGRDVLASAARCAEVRGLALDFHLIGTADAEIAHRPEVPLTIHGAYRDADLPRWLDSVGAHLIWFPAIWPETYNYVLSACIASGLPIVAPDLGAFPERLAGRAWTWVEPVQADGAVWAARLMEIARHLADGTAPPPPPQVEVDLADFRYDRDYLHGVVPAASGPLPVLGPSMVQAPPSLFHDQMLTGNPYQDRLARLRQRMSALEGGLADRDRTIRDLTQLVGEVGELRRHLGVRDRQVGELEQELADRANALAEADRRYGEKCEEVFQLFRISEDRAANYASAMRHLEAEIGRERALSAERAQVILQKGEEIQRMDQELVEQSRRQAELSARVVQLEQDRAALTAALEVARQAVASIEQERARIHNEYAFERELRHERERRLHELLHSHSWKLSYPIRAAGRLARRILRLLNLIGPEAPAAIPFSAAPVRTNALPTGPESLPPASALEDMDTEPTPMAAEVVQHSQPAAAEATVAAAEMPVATAEPAATGGEHSAAPPAQARPRPPAYEGLRITTVVSSKPVVSVIIPVYNQIEYTLACLDSIARALPRTPFEVIVVDDCSSDRTPVELARRPDVRYFRNAENLGFIGACNRGAGEARGKYLFFLNNDTTVLPGWLDWLVATMRTVPDAGLVGSKLVFPDGRLQEAGGIVFADGSGWNWGRLQNPDHPAYNFVRDVDYVSGAAILVRADLFRDLGGFDGRYAPAYYEDTDLAFAIRARGYRVLYQPLSRVIHYEGATSGTDLSAGVKKHQALNQPKFLDKWKVDLASHGSAEQVARCADRRPRFRILIVDAITPTPDQDSGSVDMFNLIRILNGLGARVTFVPESNFAHVGRYTEALQAIGVECIHAPFYTSVRQLLEERGGTFDVVLLARGPHAIRHLDDVKRLCPKAPVIFDTVDLHHLRVERRAELLGDARMMAEAKELKAVEFDVIRRCDATLVRSRTEMELLQKQGVGDRISVLPLIREIPDKAPGFDARHGLVFVGGFRHDPNVDAVQWFVGKVWPKVRERLPDAVFRIVGSNATPDVEALAGNGVEVLGFVPDIDPLLQQARLSVAPLRYGAGLKGKLASSFGFGLPAVATTIATEGMGLAPGEAVLVADEPEAFADAVVRLYSDEALWTRMAAEGLAYCRREFSLEVNADRVANLLRRLGVDLSTPEAARQAAE